MTIRDIPLDQLIPSAANVRVAKVSKQAQSELMASIMAEGLLQNLVVPLKGRRPSRSSRAGGGIGP